MLRGLLATVAAWTALLRVASGTPAPPPTPVHALQHRVVATLPHDATCFTQGLVYHRGILYESCGDYGVSSVRKVHPDTGAVLLRARVADRYFAEGLAAVGDYLYLLTWNERTMLVLRADTLAVVRELSYTTYSGEGWGLAYEPTRHRLVVSDGSR